MHSRVFTIFNLAVVFYGTLNMRGPGFPNYRYCVGGGREEQVNKRVKKCTHAHTCYVRTSGAVIFGTCLHGKVHLFCGDLWSV